MRSAPNAPKGFDMCLAVPGKILSAEERAGSRLARVEFGGIIREVYLDLVPEAVMGDYVIVHAGFALSRLDAEEAERTYQLLAEIACATGQTPVAASVTPDESGQT
jgi:hydrogenase expression/formation protein HypC